jgi:hypothetical protein
MSYIPLPVEDDEIHTDAFDPLSDDATELTGQYLDEDQSEPDLGSTVELGGQDTVEDTISIARNNVRPVVTQNLTGQSDSPPAVSGTSATGPVSGSGVAAGSVPLGSKSGNTTILSAMNTLGPALAEGTLTESSQNVTSPQTSGAAQVVLVQTPSKGLSMPATIALVGVMAFASYFLVKGLVS